MQLSPKILGLNVRRFKIVSGSLGLCLRIGFYFETEVFGFCGVFWWLGLFLAQSGRDWFREC